MCWYGLVAQANSYYASIEKISVSQGLPDTTVYSMAKDQHGFLWFGTPTGLARFDGYKFRSFKKNIDRHQASVLPQVIDTGVKQLVFKNLMTQSAANIYIDSQQRIWIGTWGEGISIYDSDMSLISHHLHDPKFPHSIGSNKIQIIFEDIDGQIWIGTNGGGLALYRQNSNDFVNFQHDISNITSISHNRVWSITQTSDGIIWVATNNGLNRLDKKHLGEFQRFRHDPADPRSINHLLVRALYADAQTLWVGTEAGFGNFDTKSYEFTAIELFSGKQKAAITDITADGLGGIWVGTQRGLFRYEYEKQLTTPLVDDTGHQLLPHNDIRDLLVDKAGILWVATRYSGVLKINLIANEFAFYQQYRSNGRNDHTINKVHALHIDQHNGLWVGMHDGLLRMDLQTKVISRFNSGDFVTDMTINSITESDNGTIWFGGPANLASLNVEQQQFTDQIGLLDNLQAKKVQCLLVDSQGSLWIGTPTEGLLRYSRDGKLTWFKHDKNDKWSISSDSILTLFEDNLQRIWIGTNGNGANRYDPTQQGFVRFDADQNQVNNLNNNTVEVIYQTNDSMMWFGTPQFLSVLNDSSGKFKHYGELNGLVSGNIKGLIEDQRGDLWITTSKGLVQFKRSQEHFSNYTIQNSLSVNEFVGKAVAKDKQGTLYFGNVGGFHAVRPETVNINQHNPKTVITQVWVDNVMVPRFQFTHEQPLRLSAQVKSIRVEFVALDFLQPNENQYQHRLIGFDDTWSEPSIQHQVTYTSLNPGRYEMQVKGSNNANHWSKESAKLVLIIDPPWWRLWWVMLSVGLTMIMLIYWWYRVRVLFIARQNRRLEILVTERTKKLSQQTEELMVAHQQLNARSEALSQTNQELSEILEQTAQYQNQLVEKEKMAALGKMVAGIAHEINTPIGLGVTATTLMIEKMEALKSGFEAKSLSPGQLTKYLEEGGESLDIIYRNLERAAELIRSFKRVSVDQSSDETRLFDMEQLINEVLLSLQPNLKKVAHKVDVECYGKVMVYSKPGAVSQVIINLISNSLIHAFDHVEAGVMRIEVKVQHGQCYLTYRDNGSGISPDIESLVFEPFATTKRGEGGSGLGMHLVYNLATQALGGQINMVNSPGHGIEFKLVFPAEQEKNTSDIEEQTVEISI